MEKHPDIVFYFTGGERNQKMASLINLPKTILEIAGVDAPECMRYPSPQSIMRDDDWKDAAFFQISEAFVGRGVRTKRWKYAVHAPQAQDLEKDPCEKNNLAADPAYREVREKLAELLTGFMVEAGEEPPAIHPAGTILSQEETP